MLARGGNQAVSRQPLPNKSIRRPGSADGSIDLISRLDQRGVDSSDSPFHVPRVACGRCTFHEHGSATTSILLRPVHTSTLASTAGTSERPDSAATNTSSNRSLAPADAFRGAGIRRLSGRCLGTCLRLVGEDLVGMASFYRRWISDFACMVAPLTDMNQLVEDPKGTIDPKTGKVRKVEKDFARLEDRFASIWRISSLDNCL